VHIHDVNARQGHLALGTGSLDLGPYIDVLSGLGIDMIIEVFTETDLKTSIEFIESLTLKR
jgi:sugar phosphate isomerase/epimerase